MRTKALESILSLLKPMMPEITVAEIQKKWNALKTNFMNEHKKVLASKRSGSGDDDVYVPKLWYYKKLLFILNAGTEPRPSVDSVLEIDTLEHDGTQESLYVDENMDESEAYSETYYLEETPEGDTFMVSERENQVYCGSQLTPSARTPGSIEKKPRGKRNRAALDDSDKKILQSASDAVTQITQALTQHSTNYDQGKNESDSFGEYIAKKLKLIKNKTLRGAAELDVIKILNSYIRTINIFYLVTYILGFS
ncbi:uncharacterized protein LOC116182422 isoform X2 [Photinus pyralis]|nr:uncharacterized protein LOC116161934 isoform X2 [Photinus pyralis]XP_031358784.1 uncharacterized protein LOC116182389 isoform X2 [Photinus pyralis]XP_031358818.1 uncharacterized protein LOC116182422 isoform X2 [Photinus pyralis]